MTSFPKKVSTLNYPLGSRIRGFEVMGPSRIRRIQRLFEGWSEILERRGYDKYYFPSVGLLKDLKREKEHFRFSGESYRLSDHHLSDHEKFLAPTGEAIIYPHLFEEKRYTRFKLYQAKSVYRNEPTSRQGIRSNEIYFHELHSGFPTAEEALAEIDELIRLLSEYLQGIGLYHRIHIRPPQDKFPGAQTTYAFDTVDPGGKVIQVATVHYLGLNFSKVYESKTPCYQVCLGITSRLEAALRLIYGHRLRELDNPYLIVQIERRGRTTAYALAVNAQRFYENKYTLINSGYTHVASGKKIATLEELRRHDEETRETVRRQTVELQRIWCNRYMSTSRLRYELGTDMEGNLVYCDSRY